MTTPRATRRPRRSTEAVRTRILEAGLELFAGNGYEATTNRDIAAAADVSPSVLFRHFESKSELLLRAVIDPFGEFVEHITSTLRYDPSGPGRSEQFITQLLEHLTPHRTSLRAVLSTLKSTDGDPLMRELGTQLDVLFDTILQLAVDTGPVPREEIDVDETDLAIRLVVGAATTLVVLDDWLLPGLPVRASTRLPDVLTRMTVRRLRASNPRHRTRTLTAPADPPRNQPPSGDNEAAPHGGRRGPDQVRRAILAAAAELFIEKGYATTTYQEIATAAETSKSALFRHFGTKSDLLVEAVLNPFADAFSSMVTQWTQVATPHRRARQPEFVADLYFTLVHHRKLVRVLMSIASEPAHPEVRDTIAAWFESMFRASLDNLAGGRRQDRWYEPALRMRAVVAMLLAASALDDWFLPHGDARPGADQLVLVMSDLITAGRDDAPR